MSMLAPLWKKNRMPQQNMGHVARSHSTPAPTGGWNARDNITSMREDEAAILDNWYPEPSDVRVRRGYVRHVSGIPGTVETLMAWNGPTTYRMFAVSAGALYDATSSAFAGSPVLLTEGGGELLLTEGGGELFLTEGDEIDPIVQGLSSSRWQHVMFGNSAGHFLYAVSGEDPPRYFDGTDWTLPTITGAGLSPNDLVHVTVFKRRLFFVEKGSLRFWYFPVETIAGSITAFDLGPLCRLGGELIAMGTWTRDGGDGIDDLAVFVTSRGEVAVFQGTDPASISTWALVGVFIIGEPIGRRCMLKLGADMVLITVDGVVPLSRALEGARATEKAALTDKIIGETNRAARVRKALFGWQPILFPLGTSLVINVPLIGGAAQQWVANTTTGAWCRYTGISASCWEVFIDGLYFGGAGGVFRAETGFSDDGAEIETDAQCAFTYLGQRGRPKVFTMLRPVMQANGRLRVALSMNVDFDSSRPTTQPVFSSTGETPWGSPWGTAWPSPSRPLVDWIPVAGQGYAAAIRMLAATKGQEIRWYANDWQYLLGRGL